MTSHTVMIHALHSVQSSGSNAVMMVTQESDCFVCRHLLKLRMIAHQVGAL